VTVKTGIRNSSKTKIIFFLMEEIQPIDPVQVKISYASFRSRLERVLAAEGGYYKKIASPHPYLHYVQFSLINLYYNCTKCLFF